MEFIMRLLVSYGFIIIYVVVDSLSKVAQFIQMKQNFTSKLVVDIFFKSITKLHRLHKSIVSDKDKFY